MAAAISENQQQGGVQIPQDNTGTGGFKLPLPGSTPARFPMVQLPGLGGKPPNDSVQPGQFSSVKENKPTIQEQLAAGNQNRELQAKLAAVEAQLKEETTRADRAMQSNSQLQHELAQLGRALGNEQSKHALTNSCYENLQENMRKLKKEVYQQRKLLNWIKTTKPQYMATLVKEYNDERLVFLEQFYEEHSTCAN